MTVDQDSTALPGAPDPWRASSMPELRPGPPFLMTEMIDAEPVLGERLCLRLAASPAMRSLADAVREAAQAHRPIMLTGCGTSEHAAMASGVLLSNALVGAGLAGAGLAADVRSVQALESLRNPPATGLLIAISHEGGTWATNQALAASRQAGARTALVTVSDRSPGAALADLVVTTDEQDQSWCHTVGYLSPLIAAAVLRGLLCDDPLDAAAVRRLLDRSRRVAGVDTAATSLARCDRLLVVGSGIDYVTSRELALKIEEGARLPATAHQLETVRHGHLAAATERTGLILLLTDTYGIGSLVGDRSVAVLRSAAALHMPAVAIVADDVDAAMPASLTSAGRLLVPLLVPPDSSISRLVNAVLGATIPFQRLAERLAVARGVNPDTLGREDPRQATAANT